MYPSTKNIEMMIDLYIASMSVSSLWPTRFVHASEQLSCDWTHGEEGKLRRDSNARASYQDLPDVANTTMGKTITTVVTRSIIDTYT